MACRSFDFVLFGFIWTSFLFAKVFCFAADCLKTSFAFDFIHLPLLACPILIEMHDMSYWWKINWNFCWISLGQLQERIYGPERAQHPRCWNTRHRSSQESTEVFEWCKILVSSFSRNFILLETRCDDSAIYFTVSYANRNLIFKLLYYLY